MGVKKNKKKKQSMSLITKITAIDIVSHIKCVHELDERENYIMENIMYLNNLSGFKKSEKPPILTLSGSICVGGAAPWCKLLRGGRKRRRNGCGSIT